MVEGHVSVCENAYASKFVALQGPPPSAFLGLVRPVIDAQSEQKANRGEMVGRSFVNREVVGNGKGKKGGDLMKHHSRFFLYFQSASQSIQWVPQPRGRWAGVFCAFDAASVHV